jgi:SAM-dependent methyltransferase
MATAPACVAALTGIDYRRAPEGDFGGRVFLRRVAADGRVSHHLSLAEHGAAYWLDHLAFREALRANPELRSRSGGLKRRLAAKHDDVEAYTRAKTLLVREALLAAGHTPRSGLAASSDERALGTLCGMGADEGYFGERVAAVYDAHSTGMFDSSVVEPAVDRLAQLAGDGRALEFAIGTGRIGLPLAERGVALAGIDNSEAMLERLREKPGAERIEVVSGDMATTRVAGEFSLVYLVFNTIFNLTTQDGQVACFENAAAHLRSGGRFVIEARVPELQRLPLGQTVLPWRADPGGLSFYVYDVVTQRLSGQHFYLEEGRVQPSPIEMRYAWPAELDLMARVAGMRLEHRWAGWRGEPFTALSPAHVSVYVKA